MPPRKSRPKGGRKKPRASATTMQKDNNAKAPTTEAASATPALETDRVEVAGPAVERTYHIIEEELELAGPAVANTYELAENILINLPARDLFRLQRVSKGFQSTINRSEPLKKKMWLLPASQVAMTEDRGWPMNIPETTLAPILPVNLETGKGARVLQTTTHMPITATFNGSHLNCKNTEISTLFGTITLRIAGGHDMTGTWQHVQLTHPPQKMAIVRAKEAHFQRHVVENEDGITFGDVYRAGNELMERMKMYGEWKEGEEILCYVLYRHAIPTCVGSMLALHKLGDWGSTNAPVYIDDKGCGWRKAFEE